SHLQTPALVAELADALGSGPSGRKAHGGSSPSEGILATAVRPPFARYFRSKGGLLRLLRTDTCDVICPSLSRLLPASPCRSSGPACSSATHCPAICDRDRKRG